jgi:mannitol/fructose-specific phosphotransferase system IIA component (Ntr-type)
MTVVAHLRPELIRIAPPWRTFSETISGLVASLVAAGLLAADEATEAVRAVTAREAEASTALLDIGAGVPHARLARLPASALAVAVSPAGLYEAVPTVPIRIVALVLSPAAANADHLHVLAEVATLLRSPDLRDALLGAPDPSDALAAFARHARAMP